MGLKLWMRRPACTNRCTQHVYVSLSDTAVVEEDDMVLTDALHKQHQTSASASLSVH